MTKTKIVKLLIAIFVIAFLITIFCVSFALKTSTINFMYSPNKLNQEIVENQLKDAKIIPYGQNVLFLNKESLKDKIEKQVSYLEILNLEIIFPNKISINCKERQAVYIAQITGSTYSYAIFSYDFKVLELTNSLSLYDDLINFSGSAINFDDLKMGDFVRFEDYIAYESFIRRLFRQTSENALKNLFTKMEIFYKPSMSGNLVSLRFETSENKKISIYDINTKTDEKVTILYNAIANETIEKDITID